MKRTHLIIGIAIFVVFAITGKYMRVDFPDKELIGQDLRLLMRSRHIYILFNALIHLVLGTYLALNPRLWQKITQIAGSIALTAASIFLIYAWYVETYQLAHFSDLSREGIYLSLAAVVLHVIGGFSLERPNQN